MKMFFYFLLALTISPAWSLSKEAALREFRAYRKELAETKQEKEDQSAPKDGTLVLYFSLNENLKAQLADSFLFFIDQYYEGEDFKTFMLMTLPKMSGTNLEDFYAARISYITNEIKRTLSHSEITGRPLLNQIIRFLKSLDIKKKLLTEKYFATLNYSNIWEGDNSSGASPTQVGEFAEERINFVENIKTQKIQLKLLDSK